MPVGVTFWASVYLTKGLRPKLVQWIERRERVEDKEKRKGEKKESKRSRKKLEMSPNFGLCACVKAKYCTIYNRSWFKI